MRTTLILLISVLLLGSCSEGSHNSAGVFVGKPSNPNLIVFVHGLSGGIGTWSAPGAKQGWPQIVHADPTFRGADVYIYNYYSNTHGDGPSIEDLSKGMATALRGPAVNIQKYEQVVFVAHSLGGLVTRRFILANKDLQSRIKGLFFFGVPMEGSYVANLADIKGSPVLKQLKIQPGYGSETDKIIEEWIKADFGAIKAFCAYEKKPTGPSILKALVVPPESARELCNADLQDLELDHNELVRPREAADYRHALLRKWYLQLFPDAERARAGEQNTPALIADCALDSYGDQFRAALVSELARLGITVRLTDQLPMNWEGGFMPLLWRQYEPKLLVVHLSCFQNSLSNAEDVTVERTKDFLALLQTIEPTKVKVVVYSNAFLSEPDFLDDEPVVIRYQAAGRLAKLPVAKQPAFSADTVRRTAFRNAAGELLGIAAPLTEPSSK